MPRKKKEEIMDDMTDVADTILDNLSKQVDIPDDKPAGISLRDRAVLHLLAGADLHRIAPDAVTHRIKRCIDIANQVVELLGEDNA